MTKAETAKILAVISAAYPTVEIPKATIAVWHDLLNDLPFDVAIAATRRVLVQQDSVHLPAPGRIRREAYILMRTPCVDPGQAWSIVRDAVRRHGWYDPPGGTWDFADELIRDAVRAIGWDTLCQSTEIGVERSHFMRIYSAMRDEQDTEGRLPPALRRTGMRRIGSGCDA
jgi:hypothetical protein